jgi:hypothetical protein
MKIVYLGLVILAVVSAQVPSTQIGAGGALGNNEALQLFSDFRILKYEDIDVTPDWGIEFPRNRLVRLLAQKGDPQPSGCDWKGSPKSEGEEITWGVMRLRCTATGWQAIPRKQ